MKSGSARVKTSESFSKAAARIAAAAKRFHGNVMGRGIRAIAEEVMTDVKASSPGHGVPVDKGILRSTGTVDGPNSDGDVELSFGGPAAPYAVVQHERVDFHHKVGEARYLVRGIERWRPGRSAAMLSLKKNAAAALKGP